MEQLYPPRDWSDVNTLLELTHHQPSERASTVDPIVVQSKKTLPSLLEKTSSGKGGKGGGGAAAAAPAKAKKSGEKKKKAGEKKKKAGKEKAKSGAAAAKKSGDAKVRGSFFISSL